MNNTFNNNGETNIAFVDFESDPEYQFKFLKKDVEVSEEKVMETLINNADITYFQYAILINGDDRKEVSSYEQASDIVQKIKEEYDTNINISIQQIYTKDIEITDNIETESICNEIVEEIKEEKRIEKATINGVYIALVPVQGNITSRFGDRENIRDHEHKGLDIAAKIGTNIKAVADGTVTYSDTMSGYGKLIIIEHGNGITTYYGHCSKLYVKEGAKVTAGDVIAAVGNTGNSTGPHLHFEIRKNGAYVNPAQYLFE